MVININKYFGQLFFIEKSLNFMAINGNLETIKPDNNNTIAYKNHLFNNKFCIHASLTFQ